jgi:DNA-binding NarL/FixJ family response regulator
MTRGARVRLFLVDDHAVVRAGIRALLVAHDRLEVVGEADTGEEAVARVPAADPDVVLLDLSLPGMSGIAVARALRAVMPAVRLVALSMHEDPEYVQGFLEAGPSVPVWSLPGSVPSFRLRAARMSCDA